MAKIYTLEEIVINARERSPYYQALYQDVASTGWGLSDLPLVEQGAFWQANEFSNNRLLCGPVHDGIIFKSGGTTGNPKFSIYSKEEWETFTELFGKGMDHNGLREGDRVANLFYSGELYASFVFIMKSLEYAEIPIVHLPVAGQTPIPTMIKIFKEMGANVLCGVPTTFMNMAAHMKESGQSLNIDRILYGGEALYSDQLEVLKTAFPDTEFFSVGYASVDGGHLGYVHRGDQDGEHRVLPGMIMEILDPETDQVITQRNRPGKLVYTNLTRTLMPIIRYPVGDMAMWTGEGRFKLLGRSDEGARVGPVTVNRDDVVHMLEKTPYFHNVTNFQMVLERETGLDRLTIRLAISENLRTTKIQEELKTIFNKERPMFVEAVENNIVAPINIELVGDKQLEKNPRTGKMRIMIDLRKK